MKRCGLVPHRTIMQLIRATALDVPAPTPPTPVVAQPRWDSGARLGAAASSLAIPGIGQVLLGRPWRGALWLAVCSAAFGALPWTGGAGLLVAFATRALPALDALTLRVARPPRAVWLVASIGALVLTTFLATALVYFKMMSFVAVHDGRMAPTLRDGEVAMIDRFHRTPELDAVVAYGYLEERQYAIGRVVGRAGDRIELRGGVLVRNGAEIRRRGDPRDIAAMAEVVVPMGHVFILNDNRDNSSDSRTSGPIALDAILGVVDYAVLTRGLYRSVD